MGKVARVALYRAPNAYALVEHGATVGADVGVNLWLNGVLVRPQDILNSAAPSNPTDPGFTYWRLIQEIPPRVTALAQSTGTGLYAITSDGNGATREIEVEDDELTIVDGNAVAGNPRLGMAFLRPAGEPISALRVVYENSDGEVLHLDPTAEAQVYTTLGVAVTAGSGDIRVRRYGAIEDAGWNWTPESLVFAGPTGTLTQTPPTSGFEVVVGYAPTPTRLILVFDAPVQL